MSRNMNNNIELEKSIENNRKCIIISAFSCLGKTYLGQNYKNILDLEASLYKWIYFDKELSKEIEKRKGIKDRIVNPNWPENYLSALRKSMLKYKVILITPEKKIREILLDMGISYLLAYPTNPDFVADRAIKRGNNDNFAQGLKQSFVQWYPDENEDILWIDENNYLEDILKRKNIIQKFEFYVKLCYTRKDGKFFMPSENSEALASDQ